MRSWRSDRSPCRRALRDLQTYLDGEADRDTSWRVARHLSRCEDCFGDADTIRAIKDAVARLRVAPDAGALVRLRRLLDTLPEPDAAP
ncbi:MAG: zf-HC2 domain-containing protein [Actinobacteria bacterium]|nr:zf-HC2 domain-containing protein [Actinomycetota bacterium]